MSVRNLEYLFKPHAIAIIGQSKQDDGSDVVLEMNLIEAGFKGPVMPVNPHRRAVAGVLTYKDIASLPETPDLAIITTPLEGAPGLITELGERGTRAVLLLSDEILKNRSDRGAELRQAILDAAKPYLLRVLGPDRLGLAVPGNGINATLSRTHFLPGKIAALTQSSAVMRAIINWTQRRSIGFSHLVSLGARLDVDFSDMLDYLAYDYQTRAILVHLERLRKPRKFMSAARVAARMKPVIVLKPCNYGEDPTEDAIYDAAFRRAGLLRVHTIEQLFNSVETLASAKPARHNRLIILGNSRSIGLLAADTLISAGSAMAILRAATQTTLASVVPPYSHTDNPVDLGDYAGAKEYEQALDVLLKEPDADGVLIVHVPAGGERDMDCARAIAARATKQRRLVMASWVGASADTPARRLLREAGIATYATPDEAARAFAGVAEYHHNQDLLKETPPSVPEEFHPALETARHIVDSALAAGRMVLNGRETSRLLEAYGIPMLTTRFAINPQDAGGVAAEIERPVALKILSPDIPEKTDVGGVALALDTPEEVVKAAEAMLRRVQQLAPQATINGFSVQPMLSRRGAFELTIGIRTSSAHFGGGPVIYFGQGGPETTVINDLAYAIPPLNMHLAHELMTRTRIYPMLSQTPGRPVNLEAIALTLLKISQMIIDLGEIMELDINPLWAGADGVLVLDAKIRVAPSDQPGAERLAIRPYPKELEQHFELPDGRAFMLRPILPEDEPALREMVRRMPAEDRRLRFFQPIKELTHDMAVRLTQLDFDREMALIVCDSNVAGKAKIWGVVRITATPDLDTAEYAVAVDRSMTGVGIGPMLMRRIIDYARGRGIKELYGEVLRENESMLKINRALGFAVKTNPSDPEILHVSLPLQTDSA